jgi:AcrR family transcriptional regulator
VARPGRRQEILEAAAALFAAHGYHGTGMRQIGDAVGIQSGSVYAHFASKEELCLEIVRQGAEDFMSAVAPIVDLDLPPRERLRRAVAAHVDVTVHSPARARVYLHAWTEMSEPAREVVRAWRDAYESVWARLLEDGAQAGEFQVEDRALVRRCLLAMASGVVQWYRPDGGLSLDEIERRLADLMLSALGAREREAAAHA